MTWLIIAGNDVVEIRVEEPFDFFAAELVRLDPADDPIALAPVLSTIRDSVARIEAFAGGQLEIEFGSGALVSVAPSHDYEAWTISGPGKALLISLPGGGVTAWGATPL